MTIRSNSLGASLDRVYRHWRERGALLQAPAPADKQPALTISISRECGSGGGQIAQLVAEQLGWPLYDRQLVDQIAEDASIEAALLHPLDEKRPQWISEIFHGFYEGRQLSGAGFAMRLRKILAALYFHGDCILLGRGAAQVLPPQRLLRIRCIAPRSYRIEYMAQQAGDFKQAARLVDQTDQERHQFVKGYFRRDPTDVHSYDLTIDTSRFSPSACCDLVIAALEARRAHHIEHQ